MSKHDLENMIFNLEERKDLKNVEFTQKAVIEVLSYLKELQDLDDDHNKLIDQYNKQYNELCKEINVHSSARERLVKKVEELKQQLADSEIKRLSSERDVMNTWDCIIARWHRKFTDLEAKLAEKEKAYTDLKELEQATKESLYASREYLDKLKSEKWALEKQLAEKEKEIEDLKIRKTKGEKLC